MSSENELYDISKYTDQELYQILDVNNPSDRELEGKINQLLTPELSCCAIAFGPFKGVITVPTITSIVPSSKKAGSPAFVLTVNGTNFLYNPVVRWNSSDRITTKISNTQLQAQITAADIAHAGTAQVIVVNRVEGETPSLPKTFTITP